MRKSISTAIHLKFECLRIKLRLQRLDIRLIKECATEFDEAYLIKDYRINKELVLTIYKRNGLIFIIWDNQKDGSSLRKELTLKDFMIIKNKRIRKIILNMFYNGYDTWKL